MFVEVKWQLLRRAADHLTNAKHSRAPGLRPINCASRLRIVVAMMTLFARVDRRNSSEHRRSGLHSFQPAPSSYLLSISGREPRRRAVDGRAGLAFTCMWMEEGMRAHRRATILAALSHAGRDEAAIKQVMPVEAHETRWWREIAKRGKADSSGPPRMPAPASHTESVTCLDPLTPAGGVSNCRPGDE